MRDIDAERDLAWLRHVGALRNVEQGVDGGYVVELADRRLLALPSASVPAFRAGVLVGWRLPRSPSEASA